MGSKKTMEVNPRQDISSEPMKKKATADEPDKTLKVLIWLLFDIDHSLLDSTLMNIRQSLPTSRISTLIISIAMVADAINICLFECDLDTYHSLISDDVLVRHLVLRS